MSNTEPSATFLPFARPDIGDAEIAAVTEAMRSGWVTTGPVTRQFEQNLVDYLGGGLQGVAVNSATAGLHLALEALGIGPGDEVIAPTLTFTATVEVVRYLGADAVLVDVDPVTLNIDPAKIRAAITPRTKAIMPVHYGGLACDMDAILAIAQEHGLKVVEDAAHALPTTWRGALVGQLQSDVTVFSFYANKTITTGEGGMAVTRDAALAQRMRVMRLHGMNRDAFDRFTSKTPAWYYEVVAPGFKYNMTDVAAAMGVQQLARLPQFVQRREQLAQRYHAALAGLPLVLPATAPAGDVHAWHLYVVRLAPQARIGRDALIQGLSDRGIGTSVHYVPLHRHPYWRDRYQLTPEQFPHADAAYQAMVSLPLFTAMGDADQERVIAALHELLGCRSLPTHRPIMWIKRAFDIAFSATVLLLLAPLLAVIALWVRRDSPGPVIYQQERVGRYGQLFRIYKFRTMRVGADAAGPQITVGADARITRAGQFLRRTKLDELPQFANVLCGDMSVVGPRPEVPKYVALYPTEVAAQVLSVRPGITDLASLAYRDESEVLARSSDPERAYVQEILPAKLQYACQYVRERSLWLDLRIISRTAAAVFSAPADPQKP